MMRLAIATGALLLSLSSFALASPLPQNLLFRSPIHIDYFRGPPGTEQRMKYDETIKSRDTLALPQSRPEWARSPEDPCKRRESGRMKGQDFSTIDVMCNENVKRASEDEQHNVAVATQTVKDVVEKLEEIASAPQGIEMPTLHNGAVFSDRKPIWNQSSHNDEMPSSQEIKEDHRPKVVQVDISRKPEIPGPLHGSTNTSSHQPQKRAEARTDEKISDALRMRFSHRYILEQLWEAHNRYEEQRFKWNRLKATPVMLLSFWEAFDGDEVRDVVQYWDTISSQKPEKRQLIAPGQMKVGKGEDDDSQKEANGKPIKADNVPGEFLNEQKGKDGKTHGTRKERVMARPIYGL